MVYPHKKYTWILAIAGAICILVFSIFPINKKSYFTNFSQNLDKTKWNDNLASEDLMKAWQIEEKNRFGFENLSIIDDPSGRFKKVIRILYPKGSTVPSYARFSGNPIGGTGFLANLHIKPTDFLHIRYSVRFADNFNFVHGGKLPGLYGGTAISGGDAPNGANGFSTRFMWREQGVGEIYAYLPKNILYGISYGRGSFQFTPGKWYTLEQELKLNTPNKTDGRIKVWVNGKQVMDINNLKFRSVDSLKIQGIFFSTFFGGDDAYWATPNDTYADFANFAVCDCYIGI